MTTPSERQRILAHVAKLADVALKDLWAKVSTLSDVDFAAYIVAAFPDLIDPYAALAADVATQWYDETPSDSTYVASPGPMPALERLTTSAQWALGADGIKALDRLSGTAQRAVFDSARDTTLYNVDREPGSTWARHASANACAFCVLMATRGAVYASKTSALRVVGRGKDFSTNFNADGTRKAGGQAKGIKLRGARKAGQKFHDDCHCVAIEVRPGGSYKPAPYVKDWKRAYKDAFDAVPDGMAYDSDNSVLKAVLSHMRTDLGSR